MEKAINKAIKEGYKDNLIYGEEYVEKFHKYKIFLDPLFWQALGKAEGWKHEESRDREGRLNGDWITHWEDFIHHLAEGKDINTFFEELLN